MLKFEEIKICSVPKTLACGSTTATLCTTAGPPLNWDSGFSKLGEIVVGRSAARWRCKREISIAARYIPHFRNK